MRPHRYTADRSLGRFPSGTRYETYTLYRDGVPVARISVSEDATPVHADTLMDELCANATGGKYDNEN